MTAERHRRSRLPLRPATRTHRDGDDPDGQATGFHATTSPRSRAAVGDSAEAELTREDAEAVEREMARGNKLYPLCMAFYVRGDDLKIPARQH